MLCIPLTYQSNPNYTFLSLHFFFSAFNKLNVLLEKNKYSTFALDTVTQDHYFSRSLLSATSSDFHFFCVFPITHNHASVSSSA